jgi:hypothetical protein
MVATKQSATNALSNISVFSLTTLALQGKYALQTRWMWIIETTPMRDRIVVMQQEEYAICDPSSH